MESVFQSNPTNQQSYFDLFYIYFHPPKGTASLS
jgi:hypothetical protein